MNQQDFFRSPEPALIEQVRKAASEAKRDFPGDSDNAKELRGVKAALWIKRLMDNFRNVTEVRTWLAEEFGVSERHVRRMEKVITDEVIMKLVLRGPVSATTAAHILEHPGLDVLRIGWQCCPQAERTKFIQFAIDYAEKQGLITIRPHPVNEPPNVVLNYDLNNHECSVCGAPNAPFGVMGSWFCRNHRPAA